MRMFAFRLGVLIGLIIGYVLGAKAGRQRYEQIAATARSAMRSGPAQQIGAEMRDAAGRASAIIEEKATDGVSRMTGKTRTGGKTHASGNGRDTFPTQPT